MCVCVCVRTLAHPLMTNTNQLASQTAFLSNWQVLSETD